MARGVGRRLTCRQEAVRCQQQLGRDLDLRLALVFESGEVSLVLVRGHFLPVAIVSWGDTHTVR